MNRCQECDARIAVRADATAGDTVTCAECGHTFEIVSGADGFDLRPALKVDEDWGQ